MTLKKVLDIPETKVEHDTTLNGDGSAATPLSIDAKVSSPITGNGDVATPLDIDENALAGSMAGSGIRNNNGDFEADLVVNAPLTGKGRTGLPLDVNSATASAEGVVSLTDSTELPTDINSDTTALTPKALEKRLKYLKPVASSGAMNAEQLSASAIKIPFLQNFTCDGGTNGKPKFDIPKEDGTFCNIDLGALGSSSSSSGIPAGFFEDIGMIVPNGSGCTTVKNGIYDYVYEGVTMARAIITNSGGGSCAYYKVRMDGEYGGEVVSTNPGGAPCGRLYTSPSTSFPGGRWVKVL